MSKMLIKEIRKQEIEINELQEKLEVYENMRKELKEYIKKEEYSNWIMYGRDVLLNILNKVGGSDE